MKLKPLIWETEDSHPDVCWTITHLGIFDIAKNEKALYFIQNDQYQHPIQFRTIEEAKRQVERMLICWIMDMIEEED